MIAFVSELNNWISIVQGILTIIAIGAGAYWFFHRRQKLPRAELGHRLQSWKLPDGNWLLRVVADIRNQGEVLLELDHGLTRVQQMRPWPDKIEPPPEKTVDRKTEIEWPSLVEMQVDFRGQQREIEPHESDTIPFEFILPATTEMVVIYTYIRNKSKRFKQSPFTAVQKEIGWSATSVYELTHATLNIESELNPGSQPEPQL